MATLESNPRGIPKAPFVESVSEFLNGDSHEAILLKFQEMISKYRFMENHLLQREASLMAKMPEIKKSLEMCEFLRDQEDNEPLEADFELNDTLWVKSKANVMLEYPIEEAIVLLTEKLASAQQSTIQTTEDLEYLKEQITTMEVNMAQVYNDDVRIKRKE